jgi:hypothetical protein
LDRIQILVAGSSQGSPEDIENAEKVGRLLAENGAVLITGGLGGVMEAASRGARSTGGLTVGILPTLRIDDANQYVELRIASGVGHARNLINVASAQCVIAIGGGWGTLSEIALAMKVGVPVVSLGSWPDLSEEIEVAANPEEAVERAMELARDRADG